MKRRFFGSALVGVLAALLAAWHTPAEAGIGAGGGTGVLDVDTPEMLPPGWMSLSSSWRLNNIEVGDRRLHSFTASPSLTIGLNGGLEASALLPLRSYYRTGSDNDGIDTLFDEDFRMRISDLEMKLKTGLPVGGERFRLGLMGVGSAPIGSDRVEAIYAETDSIRPYTRDEWNYGGVALATLDLTGANGIPLRLHANGGYYWNKNETEFAFRKAHGYPVPLGVPTRDEANDLMIASIAAEFPAFKQAAFVELSTEQFVNARSVMKPGENPILLTPGVRFNLPGGIGLTTAVSFNMSEDDNDTAFDPNDIYPDWEARAVLSFGDIFQSRKTRLEKRRELERSGIEVPTHAPTIEVVDEGADDPDLAADREDASADEDSRSGDSVTGDEDSTTDSSGEGSAAGSSADTPSDSAVGEDSTRGEKDSPKAQSSGDQDRTETEMSAGEDVEVFIERSEDGTIEKRVERRKRKAPGAKARPGDIDSRRIHADDLDGDGIPNESDRCPYLPEDHDGFRDSDGCPDLDNDQDGILDPDDLCPNQPEDGRGAYPLDGCPVRGTSSLGTDGDADLGLALGARAPDAGSEPTANSPAGTGTGASVDARAESSANADERVGSPAGDERSSVASNAATRAQIDRAVRRAVREQWEADRAAGRLYAADPSNAGGAAGAVPFGPGAASAQLWQDSDNDGILDRDDLCPTQKEDRDGFEDTDGCPDLDNDGDGILDERDQCPMAAETFNGFEDSDGCPDFRPEESDRTGDNTIRALEQRLQWMEAQMAVSALSGSASADQGSSEREAIFADHDNDGVADRFDRCPQVPEDIDGWEDQDGCPDLDNDGDGIKDRDDDCINAAETWNGFEDEDGCPDQVPAEANDLSPTDLAARDSAIVNVPANATKEPPVVRNETVFFASGGAALDAAATALLRNLVSDLAASDWLIELRGYSDSVGRAESNMQLSRRRADAVRDYLVRSGIRSSRIHTVGRGEDNPIADNDTTEGRARNRRVEILIGE